MGVSLGASPLWQASDVQTLLTNGNFQSGSFLGLDVAPSTTVTYAPAITAPVGIAKTNTGTLILSAVNSYTGPTAVRGGVLSVSSLANGGTPSGIGQSSNAASNLTFSGGSTLQYTGGTTSTDHSYSFTGGVTFDVTQAATVLTMSGSGTGSGGLTKIGQGTLAFTGLNSYGGGTVINNGLLKVSPGTLGAGPVTLNGGSLSIAAGSTNTISSNGFGGNGAGWQANGSSSFGVAPDTLQVTPNVGAISGSAWTKVPVGTGPFTIGFTYTVVAASATPADGMTIGFQNYTGGGAVAGSGNTTFSNQINGGSGLGYQGITPSAALELNIYPPNTAAPGGSGVGFLANGAAPNGTPALSTLPVNAGLVNTPTNVLLQYDGTNATLTLTQVVAGVTNTFSIVQPLNLASIVGSTAFFGFTGATGGSTSDQRITNFLEHVRFGILE